MDIEVLKKQVEEYRKDWQRTAENRDRMVQMVNQNEARMNQLSGAVTALERIINESEAPEKTKEDLPDAGTENPNQPANSEIIG